ncbi:glycosyltransferase family 2 protein [soil metagenome]
MISVIIINFLQEDLVTQCVRSIFENVKSCSFEVIVVNNSPQQKLTEITKEFPAASIIENENNGFSQANNLAASHAKGKYLLFLNGDTIFKNDFFAALENEVKDLVFGAIGLKLYNPDGTFQLSFWKENNFSNEIKNKKEEKLFAERNSEHIRKVEIAYSELKEVEWVTGASLFIEKDRFNEINGFDENFFLFYEDADICQRLRKKGYKLYFYPRSDIIHLKGVNANSSFESSTYYFSKDSQILYYKKHNSFFNRFLLRSYLLVKFFLLWVTSFKYINLKIFLRAAGIKS